MISLMSTSVSPFISASSNSSSGYGGEYNFPPTVTSNLTAMRRDNITSEMFMVPSLFISPTPAGAGTKNSTLSMAQNQA